MENASKALIIAGAILLAILIISLGIFIFNQASQITKSNNLSEVEVLNFNEKFTSFKGNNVRGSEVNSLLTRVVQNNVANQTDPSKQVKVDITATSNTKWRGDAPAAAKTTPPVKSISNALTGITYKVDYDTDSNTGLVNKITIVAN